MKRFGLRVGMALAVLCSASVGMAPHAIAQTVGQDADALARAQAKEQFQAGVAAYDAQRYGDALTHFQEAYRIKPHPLVRVNMANCYDRLGKPLQAIFHFERFLEESEPSTAQRKEVSEALRALRAKISEVTLRVMPDGASVTIDGGERRKAPILEPIRLEAGMHVIEVALAGYQTQKRDLVLEGGQHSDVEVTLERGAAPLVPPVVAVSPTAPAAPVAPVEQPAAAPVEPAPVAAAAIEEHEKPPVEEPPARAEESRPLLPTLAWVTAGASAAMFVGALITGQLALSAESDFNDFRDTSQDVAGATPLERRTAYENALAASDNADALALTSDIFLVAGLVGVGVTVYLAVDHYSGDGSSGESAKLSIAPGRISLDGRF